ncbi:AsnC family protein [Salmonella enterica]|nr:AsnC family protein [Salmonella enterica]EKB5039427.1 AsnC family protein [Salmonella enterica]EME1065103.1 AsnC family protein [Salmonella enterica]
MKPESVETPELFPKHGQAWTPEEDELLISLYANNPARVVAARLGRTITTVYQRISILRDEGRMPRNKPSFTDEQKIFIRDNCHTMTYQQVADHLGKCPECVVLVARDMGVSYHKTGNLHPNTIYPDSDVLRVRALRDKGLSFGKIGRMLDMSRGTVIRLYYRRKTKADTIAREHMPR